MQVGRWPACVITSVFGNQVGPESACFELTIGGRVNRVKFLIEPNRQQGLVLREASGTIAEKAGHHRASPMRSSEAR